MTSPLRAGRQTAPRSEQAAGARPPRWHWLLRLPGLLVPLLLAGCATRTHLSFLDPQGPVAALQRRHFIEVLGIMALFVALPIFVLTPWFAWRYRYGATRSRYAPRWEFSLFLEITAWSGPLLIVILLAYLVWRDAHALDPYKPLASAGAPLRVQVIGYDWKWLFIYPDQGIASIGVLAVPRGRPVAMQLTSATVMQSFFIPALGSQIYAMGGMVTQLHLEATRLGRFMGENTMYNGDGFHQQQFTTLALSAAGFDAWLQRVRAGGRPLDARALRAIAERSTRTQLLATLGQRACADGGIYFSGVSPGLFQYWVRSVRDGAPPPTAQSRGP